MHENQRRFVLRLLLLVASLTDIYAFGLNTGSNPAPTANRAQKAQSSSWSWGAPHVLQEEDVSPIHDRQKEERLFSQGDDARLVFDTGAAVAADKDTSFTVDEILDIQHTLKRFTEAHGQIKELLSQHERSVIRDAIQERIMELRGILGRGEDMPLLAQVLEVPVLVELKLFSLQEVKGIADLERYLKALSSDKSFVHVIKSADGKENKLPVSVKYSFNVNTVSVEVENAVSRIVRERLRGRNKAYQDGFVYIDVAEVDEVIRKDHIESHGKTTLSTSYSIYLFGIEGLPSLSAKYLYTSKDEECAFQLWKGQDRYVFVDLTATALATGPHTSGEGGVMKELLPQWPRKSNSSRGLSPAFLPKLVALISHILSYVVFPSIYQLPFAQTESSTYVQIIHIGSQRDLSQVYSSVVNELKQLPSLALENVQFADSVRVVSYDACDLCMVALVEAIRHTGLRQRAGPRALAYDSYLNSTTLSSHLHRFKDQIIQTVLGHGSLPSRVLPAFVFETDGLLLDDKYLALSSSDFVFAVSVPETERWSSDIQCPQARAKSAGNVTALESSSHRLGIDLFDAMLQSGWGVSSDHDRWCPIKKAVVPNYLFGVRRTDTLTPKLQKDAARADLSPLPFSVQDASVRNIELAQVILALEEVHQTNAHLKWYRQKRGEDLFRGKKEALIDMFAECERVMSYSLEQVGKLFALHDYEHARHYLKMLQKAARATRLLVLHTASRYKPPEGDCFI